MRSSAWCVIALTLLSVRPASAQNGAGDPFGPPPAAASDPAAPVKEKSPRAEATEAKPDVVCYWAEADAEENAKIREALRSPLTSVGLDFVETPLEEVVAFLSDEYDIEMLLDTRALDEVGIHPDEVVTVHLRNLRLESAIRLMLSNLKLTYVVRDGAVLLTTQDEAQSWLGVAIYPVPDFVEAKVTSDGRPSCGSLCSTILATVAPETWTSDGGGNGRLHFLPPSSLVISQTDEGHRQVQYFLKALRDSRKDEQADAARQ